MLVTSARAAARSVPAAVMRCHAVVNVVASPGQPDGTRLMIDYVTPVIEVRDALTLLVRSVRSA
jgi:hypothetical protein